MPSDVVLKDFVVIGDGRDLRIRKNDGQVQNRYDHETIKGDLIFIYHGQHSSPDFAIQRKDVLFLAEILKSFAVE